MESPSNIEKVAGSLTATASTTVLAAMLGGPVAALLPVLTSTLANDRHRKRVESAIDEIERRLSKIECFEKSLTDAQYKLINELIISIFNTPDDEKIEYLKTAVFETPLSAALDMHDATVLSRAINSISIGELTFLLECHGTHIVFTSNKHEGFYNVDKFSIDGERALGLISLGLLSRSPAEGTASDIGAYEFTPLSNKLVKLIVK